MNKNLYKNNSLCGYVSRSQPFRFLTVCSVALALVLSTTTALGVSSKQIDQQADQAEITVTATDTQSSGETVNTMPACAAKLNTELGTAELSTTTPTAEQSTSTEVIPTRTITSNTESAASTPDLTTQTADANTLDVNTSRLSYLTLEPFDVRFNPNREKTFAVVMNFTLFIHNNLNIDLDVRKPQFKLTIEGVAWTDVASTDFQTGTLQAQAKHGIVLQTLLLLKKANDAQKLVLDCVKAKIPVDLRLTGTLDTYLNGELQTVEANVLTRQVILPSSN